MTNTDIAILELLTSFANELDSTGDPELIKEASVLDELLLTLSAPKDAKKVFKAAEQKEIERLREKYKEEARDQKYKINKETADKDNKREEMSKAITDQVKTYFPNEAPLSTRTCPDHPGAQMLRLGDAVYQCELDKKIYNYQAGYTTMKNNKIPGGDISEQTRSLGDRPIEHTMFNTRESKLNG